MAVIKYIVRVENEGWFSGRNKKYHDMFNINSDKQNAKRYDTMEEAKDVVKYLTAKQWQGTVHTVTEQYMVKVKNLLSTYLSGLPKSGHALFVNHIEVAKRYKSRKNAEKACAECVRQADERGLDRVLREYEVIAEIYPYEKTTLKTLEN